MCNCLSKGYETLKVSQMSHDYYSFNKCPAAAILKLHCLWDCLSVQPDRNPAPIEEKRHLSLQRVPIYRIPI